jgi:two-component system, OmpR family, sensor kinase
MALTLKARLTLWHAVTVVCILAIVAAGADWALGRAVEAQIDAALIALAETEAASALDSGEPGELRVHLHEGASRTGSPSLRRLDKLVQIVDASGTVVARSATLGTAALPAPPSLLSRLAGGQITIETLADFGGEPLRLVSLPIEVEGRFRYALQVATSLGPARAFLRSARLLFALTSALILVGVVVTGRLLSGRALAPVDRLVAQARMIGASTLHDRLPQPATSDELARLVTTLNEMLDRIEHGFDAQRRFTADASHELRSPLSRLRAELEITLRRPRDATEYERVLRSCLDEVERLGRLTEALLTLARLDAGESHDASRVETGVNAVVDATLQHLGATAETRGIRLVAKLGPDAQVKVAPSFLTLVVGNLVDNALKFSPAGGEVTVTTARRNGDVVLTVADSGPGIPADEVSRVFDRFYRGRATGSPDAEGVGLGLAIVRSIVEAHGGVVTLESREAHGATFTVRLPLTTPAPRS